MTAHPDAVTPAAPSGTESPGVRHLLTLSAPAIVIGVVCALVLLALDEVAGALQGVVSSGRHCRTPSAPTRTPAGGSSAC